MKFDRDYTINWLETNRSHGFFEGFPENDMDFNELTDEELEFYFYEWVAVDIENN